MINIDEIKKEIIETLAPLNIKKIILFGSYAHGVPDEESDIDLFLVKEDLTEDNHIQFEREARRRVRNIIFTIWDWCRYFVIIISRA